MLNVLLLLDATRNSDRNSDHISPASDYQSNLNNLPQNREYDQHNDHDTLSRGQTNRTIIERGKCDTFNIQIHDRSLSCLVTGTSIKSAGLS
jgi:hypothetical protein